MKRENYDKATAHLDRIEKLKAIREKIKREFPESEYDKTSKIWPEILDTIKVHLLNEENQFDRL